MQLNQTELNNSLFKAIEKSNVEEVKRLVETGADVRSYQTIERLKGFEIKTLKQSVLNCAILNKRKEEDTLQIVEILLAAGADINSIFDFNDNWTPLMNAVVEQQPSIVQILVEHGADEKIREEKGRTVFDILTGLNDFRWNHVSGVLSNAINERKKLRLPTQRQPEKDRKTKKWWEFWK